MSTALLLLLADGRLPSGGHAVGGGVEWAVNHDDFTDHVTLEAWALARLDTIGRVEAAFAVVAAHGSASVGLLDAELSARIVGPRAREVSRQTGRQLLRAARQLFPASVLEDLAAEFPAGPHYAIVFGVAAGIAGTGAAETATLLLHHQLASIVTATVRLLAEDPIALAALQARLATRIDSIAAEARDWAAIPAAGLPSHSMPLAEVLAEDHGTWTSRLFVA